MITTPYSRAASTALTFDAALLHLRDALGSNGWDVVFEYAVAGTLTQSYRIVGALHRNIFAEALAYEEYAGLLLPWHFVVTEDLGRVTVAALDTREHLRVTNNGLLVALADRADASIAEILASFLT